MYNILHGVEWLILLCCNASGPQCTKMFTIYVLYNLFAHQFQSGDMRTVAAEGLCKLLLNDRIKSSNLVSRLLIMWYNPVTGIVLLNVSYRSGTYT
jgi:hypothetical protein